MFSDTEIKILGKAAGLIIPPSEEHGLPGADDAAIMAEIVISAEASASEVRAALAAFGEDGGICFQQSHPAEAGVLQTIVASCYYRDARVLASLGRSPGAPFPDGFTIEGGDFSLLEPVRARGPIWRKV